MERINLEEIERNAKAATPGPYFVDEDTRPGMSWNRSIDTDEGHGHTVCFMTHSDGKDPERDAATAAHIAGNYPAVTQKFCEVVRAAQALQDAHDAATWPTIEQRAALRSALSPFSGEVKHG